MLTQKSVDMNVHEGSFFASGRIYNQAGFVNKVFLEKACMVGTNLLFWSSCRATERDRELSRNSAEGIDGCCIVS